MNNTKYLPGMLDDIGFVVIFTQFEGKWVLCWHKRRESWENPGGHVERVKLLFRQPSVNFMKKPESPTLISFHYGTMYKSGMTVYIKTTADAIWPTLIHLELFPKVKWERLDFLKPFPKTSPTTVKRL